MIEVGDKVWVKLVRSNDRWTPGELLKVDGNVRLVRTTNEEVAVSFDQVSHWGNTRIQRMHTPPQVVLIPDRGMISDKLRLKEWLGRVEAELGISIPVCRYANKKQRLSVVAALLPREVISDKSVLSWREMALIGDALWRSYLIITLTGRGYRNGEVHKEKKGWESGETLSRVGQELGLQALLPIVQGTLNGGEVVEAFLGWAYTFGGKKSYLRLAQKYLAVLEGS